MSIIKLNQGYRLLVKHRLLAPTLARKFDISHWFPRGTDALGMYGHVITKISRMATKFFLDVGGVRVELRYDQFLKFHAVIKKLLLDED